LVVGGSEHHLANAIDYAMELRGDGGVLGHAADEDERGGIKHVQRRESGGTRRD
jgi:hypothetical protein